MRATCSTSARIRANHLERTPSAHTSVHVIAAAYISNDVITCTHAYTSLFIKSLRLLKLPNGTDDYRHVLYY